MRDPLVVVISKFWGHKWRTNRRYPRPRRSANLSPRQPLDPGLRSDRIWSPSLYMHVGQQTKLAGLASRGWRAWRYNDDARPATRRRSTKSHCNSASPSPNQRSFHGPMQSWQHPRQVNPRAGRALALPSLQEARTAAAHAVRWPGKGRRPTLIFGAQSD